MPRPVLVSLSLTPGRARSNPTRPAVTDQQIADERFLVFMNDLLSSGHVRAARRNFSRPAPKRLDRRALRTQLRSP